MEEVDYKKLVDLCIGEWNNRSAIRGLKDRFCIREDYKTANIGILVLLKNGIPCYQKFGLSIYIDSIDRLYKRFFFDITTFGLTTINRFEI